ncbi:adapter protein MecA [Lachnobacterium bovis]|uniref:Uncharacterized protein n=1 Tax=Lachnobacterium bovis TaxID=140626 RepID=A0A1H9Q4H4_9FIRM|nr:adapter protein MecA [Lachnobacterium bovis]SER54753.1 hypothetical protein SAMN02910429_00425 [Lachnobacterium bovis]
MVKINITDKNDKKNQINFLYVYENEFDTAIDDNISGEVLKKEIKKYYRSTTKARLGRFSKLGNQIISDEVAKIAKNIVGQYEFSRTTDISNDSYIFSHLIENPEAFKDSLEELTSIYGIKDLAGKPVLAISYSNKRGIKNIINETRKMELLVSIDVDRRFVEKSKSIDEINKVIFRDLFGIMSIKSKFSQKLGLVTGYSQKDTSLSDIKYFDMLEDFFWNEFESKLLCGRMIDFLEEDKPNKLEKNNDDFDIFENDIEEDLYNRASDKRISKTRVLYKCNSIDNICKVAKFIDKNDNQLLKSIIYKFNKNYYLSFPNSYNGSLMSEYKLSKTNISLAYIKEHGRKINNLYSFCLL